MLTASQIKWASQHDWFIRSNDDGTIAVRELICDGAGKWEAERFVWGGTFAELRAWAGY